MNILSLLQTCFLFFLLLTQYACSTAEDGNSIDSSEVETSSLADYMNSGIPRIHDTVSIITGSWIEAKCLATDTVAIEPYKLGYMYSSSSIEGGSIVDGWDYLHPSRVRVRIPKQSGPSADEPTTIHSYEAGGSSISYELPKGDKNIGEPQLKGTGFTFTSSIASPNRSSPYKTTFKITTGRLFMRLANGTKRKYTKSSKYKLGNYTIKNFRLIEETSEAGITQLYEYSKDNLISTITTQLQDGTVIAKVEFKKIDEQHIECTLTNGRKVIFRLKKIKDKKSEKHTTLRSTVVSSLEVQGGRKIDFDYCEASSEHIRRIQKKCSSSGATVAAKFYPRGTTKVNNQKFSPKTKADGRFLSSRVRELYTKSYPGQKDVELTHTFYYKKGKKLAKARIRECDGYETKYEWRVDTNRIRWVKKSNPGYTQRVLERFMWNINPNKEGYLTARAIFDTNKQPVALKEWIYDEQGNVVEEVLRGALYSSNATKLILNPVNFWKKGADELRVQAKYDDAGRKIAEILPSGIRTEFAYNERGLVTKKLLIDKNGVIIKRHFYEYDYRSPLAIERVIDDGASFYKDDMTNVTARAITRIQYRQQMPYWGEPIYEAFYIWTPDHGEVFAKSNEFIRDEQGRISQLRQIGSDGISAKITQYEYDQFDRPVKTVYPDGLYEIYTYDQTTGRVISTTSAKGKVDFIYDCGDRIIREDASFADGSKITQHTTYDKTGRRITTIDERGRKKTVSKDSSNRVVEEEHYPIVVEDHVVIPKTKYVYNGNTVAKVMPNGITETTLLSLFGKPLRVTSSFNNNVTTYTYDFHGRQVEKDDGSGLVTTTQYNPLGQVTQICQRGAGNVETILSQKRYNQFGIVLEETVGAYTYYSYDAYGRVIVETVVDKITQHTAVTKYKYDPFGKLIETRSEALGTILLKKYDLADRVIEEKNVSLSDLNHVISHVCYIYDSAGMLTETQTHVNINSDAKVEKFEYGAYNKISATTNSEGLTTFLKVDLQGAGPGNLPYLVETVINPDGTSCKTWKNAYDIVIQVQQFDPLLRVISSKVVETNALIKPCKIIDTPFNPSTGEQDGDSSITVMEYDSVGNCVTLHRGFTSCYLRTTRYYYDSFSRKITEVKPSGIELYSKYDVKGRLLEYTSSDGTISYSYIYNDIDLPTQVIDHATHQSITRSYSGMGALLCETLPEEIHIQYTLDAANRPIVITGNYFSPISYEYENNALKSIKYKEALCTYKSRNLLGRVQLGEYNNTISFTHSYDVMGRYRSVDFSSHQNMSKLSLFKEDRQVFDPMGRLIKRSQQVGQKEEFSDTYSYDHLGQVTFENTTEYQFDSLNRAKKFQGKSCTYSVLHEPLDTGKIYDVDGRRVKEQSKTAYKYDALDRLTAVQSNETTLRYYYDAFHRRTKKETTTYGVTTHEYFLYLGENEVGSLEGQIEKQLVSFRVLGEGLGAEIGASIFIEKSSVLYLPIHDLSGNIRLLVDYQTASIAEECEYTAFGPKEYPENAISPWTFSSKRSESITGHIFFGRRYYDPDSLMWLTLDPLGLEAGPNLYAYVKNNPLTQIDLYGLFDLCTNSSALRMSDNPFRFSMIDHRMRLHMSCGNFSSSSDPFLSTSSDTTFYSSTTTISSPEIKVSVHEEISGQSEISRETQIEYTTPSEFYSGVFMYERDNGIVNEDTWIAKNAGKTFDADEIVYCHANGISVIFQEAVQAAQAIIDVSNERINTVIMLFTRTEGKIEDAYKAISNVIGFATEDVKNHTKQLSEFYKKCDENRLKFESVVSGHSRGAAIQNVILSSRDPYIDKFSGKKVTFGGAALITSGTNYYAPFDVIRVLPLIASLTCIQGLDSAVNITITPFRLESPLQAHGFLEPSYQWALKHFIENEL